jgi:hypothetical protein
MADMLIVPALEPRDPITLLVHMEARDFGFHDCRIGAT